MSKDCPQCQRTAAMLRNTADQILGVPANALGINPDLLRMLVEVTAVGTAQAVKVKGKKRKASAYARAYGAAYKRLKKKHPRAQHKTLVKRAHAEARRKKK